MRGRPFSSISANASTLRAGNTKTSRVKDATRPLLFPCPACLALTFIKLTRLDIFSPQHHNQNNSTTTTTLTAMSSPSHRRQRSSQSGTPKRKSQRNAIPSSPPDPAAAQLLNEAASSQGNGNNTPRRAPQSSSPMMYRSSPADIARANREREVSSPLRQMSNTQSTQNDGDRTPRASGLLRGQR